MRSVCERLEKVEHRLSATRNVVFRCDTSCEEGVLHATAMSFVTCLATDRHVVYEAI